MSNLQIRELLMEAENGCLLGEHEDGHIDIHTDSGKRFVNG